MKMTPLQRIQTRTQNTKRAMKKCLVFSKYARFGFKTADTNGAGECSGCYDPDTNEIEKECRECERNEYYIPSDAG